MMILLLAISVILLSFGFVVLRGAPYVPTLSKDARAAIDMVDLQRGTTIVDLGSGDGRILLIAAQRGYRAIGYELNPLLVILSKWRCRKYRNLIEIRLGDFWRSQLPDSTGAVFVFLADPFMSKLDRFLRSEAERIGRPIMLISYGFELPGVKPYHRKDAVTAYLVAPSKKA